MHPKKQKKSIYTGYPDANCERYIGSNGIIFTCLVIASNKDKNVIEISKLNAQLVEVAKELPKLLAQSGYISEFIVQGMGPIPGAKKNKYDTKPNTERKFV